METSICHSYLYNEVGAEWLKIKHLLGSLSLRTEPKQPERKTKAAHFAQIVPL